LSPREPYARGAPIRNTAKRPPLHTVYLSLDSLAPLLEERREQDADKEVPALSAA